MKAFDNWKYLGKGEVVTLTFNAASKVLNFLRDASGQQLDFNLNLQLQLLNVGEVSPFFRMYWLDDEILIFDIEITSSI